MSHQQDRRIKLEHLQSLGVNPFDFAPTKIHPINLVREQYNPNFTRTNGPVFTVAGRILLQRGHGKLKFITLTSPEGNIQLALDHSRLSDLNREVAKLLDLGDILTATGNLAATQTGEITIWVDQFKIVSKALTPPPDKVDGLKDIETRYRNRHVDLWDYKVRNVIINRSKIITQIRSFLNRKGFIEVETPILQSSAGGAIAQPFVTHHNSLDADLYMRIAPELYLKRLVIGGIHKVYELGKNFRNEGIDHSHNPEFTSLEVYEAYGNYESMMDLVEEMIRTVANNVFGKMQFAFRGNVVDLSRPWERICLGGKGYDEFDKNPTVQPTFIYDLPSENFPLAKSKDGIAKVFELMMGEMEIAPGYTEQTDPDAQLAAFGGKTEDLNFIESLKAGMPPCGGLGLGIDRLTAIMTEQDSIRDTIAFPLMKD